MEIRKLQVAENLNEKQHVWWEGNMVGRSYNNRHKHTFLGRKKFKRILHISLPKFISKLHLMEKLLRISQCKATATSVKHRRYTNINDILIRK